MDSSTADLGGASDLAEAAEAAPLAMIAPFDATR
jgi:hypothetical protein